MPIPREHAEAAPRAGHQMRRAGRVSLPDACVRMLTEAIERGVYPPGSPLPSETELADHLAVSRATLREALRTLEDRQLVVRRHGRGTFVSTAPIVNDLHRNFGITAMIRAAGYAPSTAGQEIRTAPAQREAADKLGLAPGEEVTWLRRIRLADKRPVVLSDEVFPARVLTASELARLDETGQSLYGFLYKERGFGIYRGLAELTPVKASAEIAAALEVARGSLLLRISQVDYDDTGAAVLYSVEYHLPNWVRFTIERIGPGSAVDD